MDDATAPTNPAVLPVDPGQALAAGSLDVNALLDVAAAGPLAMIDGDLAATTEAQAQALAKSRPEIATARALVLLTQECARWHKAYTDETKRCSDFVGEIAHVLDPVVPAQLDAKNRLAAAAAVLVERVKDLEAATGAKVRGEGIIAQATFLDRAQRLHLDLAAHTAVVLERSDHTAVARDRMAQVVELLSAREAIQAER